MNIYEKVKDTPGKYLLCTLERYDITNDELLLYALISKKQLDNIINGNALVPLSIMLYLKNTYNIPIENWIYLNTAYNYILNRRFNSVKIGYEKLLNVICFEKESI